MISKILKPVATVLVLAVVAYQPCVYAASIPSKMAENQELASRTTDLALARSLFATDRIAEAMAAQGLTPEQVEARLAALSTADVLALGVNPDQIQSAGITMTRRMWTVIGIGAAVAVGAFALANDDGEDTDDSDDGED